MIGVVLLDVVNMAVAFLISLIFIMFDFCFFAGGGFNVLSVFVFFKNSLVVVFCFSWFLIVFGLIVVVLRVVLVYVFELLELILVEN